MLTQETKRKIDSARNILVGKVPDPKAQVDQITTALIYKFMDDMDKEAMELGGKARFFTKGFEKYAWTKLLDQKLGGHERLELYGEAVAKMSQNPHIPQLFRDIFKDAFLPYRSPETLTLFLKEINGFTYDHSEDLGNAFEYLLSILGSQGDAGQFRTPRHIIDFIAEVVDPKKGDKILDPACGTAGFLISAYKHILKQQKDKPLTPDEKEKLMNSLVGYDISPDMVKLSKVNMYLHGFAEPKIFEYDTLSSEEKWDEMYDVIMANPPFMTPTGGIKPHKRFSVQANRAEVLFVDYIKEHLRPNGRAGIIVPEGVIFQSAGAYKQLRKMLVEDGLFAVVSLPAGVFNPYANVKTSILVFDNALAKKTDKILFIRVLNDGFDLGAQRRPRPDLPNDLVCEGGARDVLLAQRIAIETGTKNKWLQRNSIFAYEITKEQISKTGDYNLSAEIYRVDNLKKTIKTKYPMVKVGEVANYIRGITFSKKDQVYQESDNTVRVATTKAAQENGIVENDLYFIPKSLVKKQESFLKEGDILISIANSLHLVGRTTFIEKQNSPITFGAFMGMIRADEEKIIPKYLYRLISTQTAKKYFLVNARTTTSISNIGSTTILDYEIPLPPIEIQKEIIDQIETKQKAIEHAKAIIDNLERERGHFGQLLRNLENIEMTKLSEICEFTQGIQIPQSEQIEQKKDGYKRYIYISDLMHDKSMIYVKDQYKNKEVSNKDLIMINTGNTSGKVFFGKDGILSNNVFKITHSEKIKTKYLYYFLKSDAFFDKLKGHLKQGAQPHLGHKIIGEQIIPLPSLEIQKQLVDEADKEQEIIRVNEQLIEIMEKKISVVLENI